jgi:serine/threonine-protein kinase
MLVAPPPSTQLRLGTHEVLIELAAGGMATVYVARKVGAAGFERLVVVKRIHQAFVRNREFVDMFREEARICSTIRHPNVVQIFDVVESEGELFLVLEYVESLSIRALVTAARDSGEALPPNVVVRVVADALAGLHAAHEAKDLRGNRLDLIHRDVSPQNIIVGVDGSSRLIDFGIAKATSRVSVTTSGVLKGKLGYMSPEQVRRRPLDRRADLFAAGVVLFEALTNRRLFDGEDEGDIVLSILIADIPAPSTLVPGLPAALDDVVTKALARDPDERYQTAAEFQEALERALPPARARDVTRTVERYGAVAFEERRSQLAASLHQAADRDAVVERERSQTTPAVIESSAPRTSSVRIPRHRGASLVLVTCLLTGGAAAGAVLVERSHEHDGRSGVLQTPPAASATGADTPETTRTVDGSVGSTAIPNAPTRSAAPTPASAPNSTAQRPPAPDRGIHHRNPYATP